jgi:hypothetical protein
MLQRPGFSSMCAMKPQYQWALRHVLIEFEEELSEMICARIAATGDSQTRAAHTSREDFAMGIDRISEGRAVTSAFFIRVHLSARAI